MKYILELSKEQLAVLSRACEFYARIRIGQFEQITWNCLDWKNDDINNICNRRDEAERLLFEVRKQVYPDLHGRGHSYGIGKFEDADLSFDIYQVTRNKLGDDRPPFSYHPLPKIYETDAEEICNECTKMYAIWRDRKVIGYVRLTDEQAVALNTIPEIGLYFGFDKKTNPEKYLR